MLTVCGQQHSFSSHEWMLFLKGSMILRQKMSRPEEDSHGVDNMKSDCLYHPIERAPINRDISILGNDIKYEYIVFLKAIERIMVDRSHPTHIYQKPKAFALQGELYTLSLRYDCPGITHLMVWALGEIDKTFIGSSNWVSYFW